MCEPAADELTAIASRCSSRAQHGWETERHEHTTDGARTARRRRWLVHPCPGTFVVSFDVGKPTSPLAGGGGGGGGGCGMSLVRNLGRLSERQRASLHTTLRFGPP